MDLFFWSEERMSKRVLFFDDGGVLNNNKVRGEQWKKFIADYFTPRFGGEPTNWMKANIYAMGFVIDYLTDIQEKGIQMTYRDYKIHEDVLWTEKMFEYTGLQPPPEEDYAKLVEDVYRTIVPQVHSEYPGIINCLKQLSKEYEMNTASNTSSMVLDLYFIEMTSYTF